MKREKTRRIRLLDLLLITGSIASFTTYAVRAYYFEQGSGSEQALGQVLYGSAQRKLSGNVDFSDIGPGTPVYNRDVLWVQDSPWLAIDFDDGSKLQARQGSLIVISRSLRGDRGGRINVLRGEVFFDRHWTLPWENSQYEFLSQGRKVTVSENDNHVNVKADDHIQGTKFDPSPVRPSPAPSLQASPSPAPIVSHTPELAPPPAPISVHPKPGSIIIKGKGLQAQVRFTWANEVSGTFQLSAAGMKPLNIPLKSARSVTPALEVEHNYQWILEDSSGQKILGPFEFSLFSASKHPISELIKNETKATIEMLP